MRSGTGDSAALGVPNAPATATSSGASSRNQPSPFTADQIEAVDLRRPGRHRDRERPPLHGARGRGSGPHRDPRATDGDGRDPPRHQQLAHRRRAGVRLDRRERGEAVRGGGRPRSRATTASCCTVAPSTARGAEGVEALRENASPCAERRGRGGARRSRPRAVDTPDVLTDPESGSRRPLSRRLPAAGRCPDAPGRRRHRSHHAAGRRPAGSATRRSSCFACSPTRPSSPSRMFASSRSWRSGIAI